MIVYVYHVSHNNQHQPTSTIIGLILRNTCAQNRSADPRWWTVSGRILTKRTYRDNTRDFFSRKHTRRSIKTLCDPRKTSDPPSTHRLRVLYGMCMPSRRERIILYYYLLQYDKRFTCRYYNNYNIIIVTLWRGVQLQVGVGSDRAPAIPPRPIDTYSWQRSGWPENGRQVRSFKWYAFERSVSGDILIRFSKKLKFSYKLNFHVCYASPSQT